MEEAIKQVQDLYTYFEKLERMIARQLVALQRLNYVETEVSLYYQQEGCRIIMVGLLTLVKQFCGARGQDSQQPDVPLRRVPGCLHRASSLDSSL